MEGHLDVFTPIIKMKNMGYFHFCSMKYSCLGINLKFKHIQDLLDYHFSWHLLASDYSRNNYWFKPEGDHTFDHSNNQLLNKLFIQK